MYSVHSRPFHTMDTSAQRLGLLSVAWIIVLFGNQTVQAQPSLIIDHRSGGTIFSLSFSPDSKLVAASSFSSPGDGLTVWNVATGKKVFGSGDLNVGLGCVIFSQLGKTLATTGGKNEPVRVYDTSTWKIRQTLKGTELDGTRHLAFAHDGTILVTLAYGGAIKFWDPATGKQVKKDLAIISSRPESSVYSKAQMALSPNGKTLAVAAVKDVVLWDLTTGKEQATLKGHVSSVVCVAISPDGKTLVTTENGDKIDNKFVLHVCVWDLETNKLKYRLDRQKKITIKGIAFSPDSKTMATAGDGQTQLWEVGTGRHLMQLEGGAKRAVAVAWSPDGLTIAEGALNGTITLFDVPKELVGKKHAK